MSRFRWLTLYWLSAAGLIFSACAAPAAAPPTPEATLGPTSVPTVARAAASVLPSPSPAGPTPTVEVTRATTMSVGNTDGQGVYVRKTPLMSDRLKAYPDGTVLTIVGDDVDGDGQHWKHVKTPDGVEGYVPSVYTVDVQP